MQAHIICLGADTAVRAALPPSSPDVPVHLYQVLRHIPTDSVSAAQAQRSIVPDAQRIAWIVEIGFADAQAQAQAQVMAQPAWRAFEAALGASKERLFAFDTAANLPIVPTGAAAAGGFRRWMLLERALATASAFREGWFGRHAQLVQQLPGVDGYVQHLVSQSFGSDGQPLGRPAICVDGIAQMCFADEAAMLRSYASDARLPLRDDGRTLLGGIVTLLVQGRPA